MNENSSRYTGWPQIRGKFSISAFGPFPSVRINEVTTFQESRLEGLSLLYIPIGITWFGGHMIAIEYETPHI